jgi:hypothetical protein
MTDIVERLRAEAFDAVNWDGETMKQWDKIRKQAETLPGSDLPRLMFQGLIESLAELMVESACEIERLRNAAQISTALRDYLVQIRNVCRDNAPLSCDQRIALDYVQQLTVAALSSAERGA